MKSQLRQLITQALTRLQRDGGLPMDGLPPVVIERTRDPAHGDFACNIAMVLAKAVRRKPRELAEQIVAALPHAPSISKTEIAGPGFINFFLSRSAYHQVVAEILQRTEDYGRSAVGADQRVQVEFVSANPTGPLHVGHGRGAAFGATLANLLEAAGFAVQREYYVNDAGRQMDILASSVWLRYLERFGEELAFPAGGYRGDYVRDIAERFQSEHGGAYVVPAKRITEGLPPDAPQGDKDAYIDALSGRAKQLLGEKAYRRLHDFALNTLLDDIRDDLAGFNVVYDEWFSEYSLTSSGAVERALQRLQEQDHVYEREGALWFRAASLGDEKDRVVRRANGQTTYLASDVAYLMNKFERGFDRLIYVLGADHHGYIARLKAVCAALGYDPGRVEVLLVQFAILYRGGERMQMSTRSGEFVTLRELREEVGCDAARFFYVSRKSEQHLDFDLDLAKSQSKDNPVYYIQYAHARVCSVMSKLQQSGLHHDPNQGLANLQRLKEAHEDALLVALSRYPEVVESAALNRDPHQVAHYLRELANAFHSYYNEHRVLVDDAALRDARLSLSLAVRQVLRNGLRLLGVSAPELM